MRLGKLGENVGKIYRNYSFFDATRLLASYLGILVRNRLIGRKLEDRVLSFAVSYPNRHTFFGQFVDIFVNRPYRTHSSPREVKRIFDCGANIGMGALYFSWVYPNARITCVEPGSESLSYLRQNVAANGLSGVDIVGAALGKAAGEATLGMEVKNQASTGASLLRADEPKGERVSVVPLSALIDSPVDILKLDVEGMEGHILEELRDSGKLRLVGELVMEYHHDGQKMDYPMSKITGLLSEHDFEFSTDYDAAALAKKRGLYTCILRASLRKHADRKN